MQETWLNRDKENIDTTSEIDLTIRNIFYVFFYQPTVIKNGVLLLIFLIILDISFQQSIGPKKADRGLFLSRVPWWVPSTFETTRFQAQDIILYISSINQFLRPLSHCLKYCKSVTSVLIKLKALFFTYILAFKIELDRLRVWNMYLHYSTQCFLT